MMRIAAVVPFAGARRWKMALLWASRCVSVAGSWAVLNGATVSGAMARVVEAHPASLSIDAMLNEPLVFRIEVSSEDTLGEVDLAATGLRIQREIKAPVPNRRVFLIEPDTSRVGQLNGSIAVLDRNGATLCTVPVTGEVKPYVLLSPARLFLGSLEYGTTSGNVIAKRFRLSAAENWNITGVDVSNLPGAEYEVIDLDARSKELQLRISEDALKAGEPFGAFINKAIRIQTNFAAQPEISIPVTAMLSKNGTSRNFSTFVFKGNQRWQGKWGTPNIAAAVMGPLVLLALGYGAWFLRANSRRSLTLSIGALLCIGALAGMLFLAKTYSRGGWTAFGVGLVLLTLLMTGRRHILMLGATAFAIMAIALPAGAQRVVSAAAVAEDRSISNRLLVWRGALEMIADNPIRGVGVGCFGEVFQSFYQEPWHKASYSTAMNDYLTFAAERGLVPTLAILAVTVLLSALIVQLVRKYEDGWVAPLLCALITISISSLFSSIEFVREIRILTIAGTSFLLSYSLCRIVLFKQRGCLQPGASHLCLWRRSAITASAVVCLAFGIVTWTASARSVCHQTTYSEDSMTGEAISIIYEPSGSASKGTVLFLPQEMQSLKVTGRRVLRPLASNGWRALSLKLPSYDQEASTVVERLLREVSGPLIILAEKSMARVAIGAAQNAPQSHKPGLALIEPVLHSALSECDKSRESYGSVHRLATVEAQQWETFKQDSRGIGRHLTEVLNWLAAGSSAAPSDRHLAYLLEAGAQNPEPQK